MTSVDGNKEYRLYYKDCAISLLPGPHAITYKYYFSSNVSTVYTDVVTHKINVEKGQVYRIKYRHEGHRWIPWIEKLQGEEYIKQRKELLIRLQNMDA